MNRLAMAGIALVILGVLGLAIPHFTTQNTEEVARIGDLKIQTTDTDHHTIPPYLAGGAILIGLIMAGAALTKRA